MSRFDVDYDSEGPNTVGLWRSSLQRAINSARGQRLLREIEAALLAMPEHKLIADEIAHAVDWDEDGDPIDEPRVIGVCVVGAYAAHQRARDEGVSWARAVFDLAEELGGEVDCWETQELGVSLGMARTIAWELAYVNDERFGGLTDECRWEAVLGWVRERILPDLVR
jgi:hypothetical protein